jgi:hypothetical protein
MASIRVSRLRSEMSIPNSPYTAMTSMSVCEQNDQRWPARTLTA